MILKIDIGVRGSISIPVVIVDFKENLLVIFVEDRLGMFAERDELRFEVVSLVWKMSFINYWKVTKVFVNPNIITINSKYPNSQLNLVLEILVFFTWIWWYALSKSILVKNWALLSLSIIVDIKGNEYTSLIINLYNLDLRWVLA